jgi:hypothetical protein
MAPMPVAMPPRAMTKVSSVSIAKYLPFLYGGPAWAYVEAPSRHACSPERVKG